jgi:diguanylate cyclase
MSAKPRLPAVAWPSLIVVTAVYMAWGVFPEASLYRELLTPRVLLAIAAVAKIGCLLSGALLAFACRDRLEEGNPARPAWALLATGLFATLAGQLSLAPHQLVAGETPFPSVADLFYVLSYPFLIAAFLVFLRAHHDSGFSTSSLAERLTIVAAIAVVGGAGASHVLRPVAAGGGEILDRMLNVAYPLLDLVLLMPLALLLRMALRMRGSHVGGVWALLLAGFVSLSIGDICFAYFSTLGELHLDPYVHATFILSYGLITGGAYRQLRLLKS